MSKSVLVAVDITHPDDAARLIKRAASLAETDQAHLATVTVIPDYGMSIVGSFFKEGTRAKAIEMAAETLHKITADTLGADYPIQHVVRHGTAYEEVLHASEQVDADLIVIGAHKPDFADYLLGPNAARVVRHASASVLVERT